MSRSYQQFGDLGELPRLITGLAARTLVFDIEPLIADWYGTQDALERGIGAMLGLVAAIPDVQAVCFSTNSARLPATLPSVAGIEVIYLASARKPLNLRPYDRLPTPGVVIGDQVLTDGLLARRLGYFFLQYRHPHAAPVGPRLLDNAGRLARPLIFRR